MAIPMRTIETFTSIESIKCNVSIGISEQEIVEFSKRLFSYLIDQNYYKNVRKMLDEKINDNTYDELSTKPQTEISKVILEMIERPLKLVYNLSVDESFDSKILIAFINEILARDSNYTISNFIIPSLAAQVDFPFIKLINLLYNVYTKRKLTDNNNQGKGHKINHDIKFNGYLLYAILHLDVNHIDDIINRNMLEQYLIVIGSMIGCITKLPRSRDDTKFSNYYDNDDSAHEISDSDEDEDENNDEEMQPQFERLILKDIIQELNRENRVNKIVKNVDSILYLPNVIHSLCVIAHNMMIYNRTAISDYR